MTKPNINRIVKDILILAHAIERGFNKGKDVRGLNWGRAGDAERIQKIVDMEALRRCIAFALELEYPAGWQRAIAAAERLHAVLADIERNQIAIEQRLAKAA